jgi:superfamily I DNA/RNA helicase
MKKLLFKTWLSETAFKEDFQFGKFAGRSLNQAPSNYLQWMWQQMNSGATFNVTDNGVKASNQRVKQEIEKILQNRGENIPSAAKDSPEVPFQTNREFWQAYDKEKHQHSQVAKTPPATQQQQPQAKRGINTWLYAKSTQPNLEAGLPIAGLDLAAKQFDENWYIFVILDKDENRIVSRGRLAKNEVGSYIKSEKIDDKFITGDKPSDILKQIINKPKSKSGTIPEERMTDEQNEIDQRFLEMMNSPGQSHMMISALAGSGKTTMLKHLAWKYSKGQKWLYLVFNSKNKEEAKDEFPKYGVQVETTNGWAGREVLAKNNIKPTDRIKDYSTSDKAKLLADSPSFKNFMQSLGIPDQDKLYGSDPNRLGGTQRSLWYTVRNINKEIKMEVVKLLGLAKSFAIDPRKTKELESKIEEVMSKYDLNTNLDDIKDNIQKNSPWSLEYIDKLFGTNFLQKDFAEEIKKATIWLLEQVMPHATKETFIADSDKFNKGHKGLELDLGSKRDFDDDLWFAAIHADELKWPKYDVVLADEVQDFNVAQQIILKKLIENGAKVVAVGDRNQSIYRFRGADSNAFGELGKMLQSKSENKNIEYPLTKNFRSRQAIIDLTNQEGEESDHVSNLVKGRDFKEGPGKIGQGKATKYEMSYNQAFDTLSNEMKEMGEVKQTAFLSRTNEPLVHASLNLMKKGIPFVILGKDIANELSAHMDKVISLFRLNKQSTVDELQMSLREHNDEQIEKHSGKAAKASNLKELKETTDAIMSAIDQFNEENENEEATIFEFKNWLNKKFGGIDIDKSGAEGERIRKEFQKQMEEKNPVILTTVHKSKGLQFQRVYILRDDLWPHPRSKRLEDLEQELNNKYIGRTRAEDELHILDLEGQPGYKPKSNE